MASLSLESLVQGAVSCERGDGWIKPWRLPFERLRLFPPEEGLISNAEAPAGVRLRFRTDSPRLELLVVPSAVARPFDLVAGAERLQTAILPAGEEVVTFEDLPAGQEALEIWLSQSHPTALREIRVVDGSRLEPAEDTRPRWITYGSSITHCNAAHSPSRTWPGTAARARNLHLTCLGYSGNCHIEPMIARMIRDLPADLITLKLGINVQGGASLSGRTVRGAIIGMVQIIREKHPDVPIGVISPIISPPREDTPNVVGMSLSMMRAQVQDAVVRLQDCGDTNLHYYDGLQVFGEDLVERLPDLLHPDGDGYEILGRRISDIVLGSAPFARVLRPAGA